MSTRPAFDPDDDPAQQRGKAVLKDPLGEDNLVRAARMVGGRAVRPRDAATLVLYRLDDYAPRILMGCRSAGHDFMPDKFVFPGGRVDAGDGAAPSVDELSEPEAEALRTKCRRQPRAFALTAIRETFEETGLIVGKPGEAKACPESWAEFYALGVSPALSGLSFVGRAITPPMRHKRFDARFLMADASKVLVDDRPPVDGAELNMLKWFTLKEIEDLDLPNVTRYVISEVEARLVKQEALRPFYLRWTPKGHVRERL
jgi:8-oxo-dGTP pyrophosphatase MutT (NUDIX family)